MSPIILILGFKLHLSAKLCFGALYYFIAQVESLGVILFYRPSCIFGCHVILSPKSIDLGLHFLLHRPNVRLALYNFLAQYQLLNITPIWASNFIVVYVHFGLHLSCCGPKSKIKQHATCWHHLHFIHCFWFSWNNIKYFNNHEKRVLLFFFGNYR